MKNFKNENAKTVAAFQSNSAKSSSFTNKNQQPQSSQLNMGSQPQGSYKQPVKNQSWQKQITNRQSNINSAAGKSYGQK